MKQQLGFKWDARVGPGHPKQSRISYDPHHEIRDQMIHGRGEDQPLSQETLI